ncbi:sodium-dependent glucose transporter 1A-like [Ptychodera flava]|uniref:sodium-dependent glucose transporter 1A-like n=1 Tax=Ptychodera flava TaxID=63121 RepID=UPI003969D961
MESELEDTGKTSQFITEAGADIACQDKVRNDEKVAEASVLTDETAAKTYDEGEISNRRFKTVLIGMAFLGLVMTLAIPGPTLLDLQAQVHTTFEKIALVLSVANIGYLIGSVFGGFLFDRFDSHLVLALTMFGLAVLGASVPWCLMFIVLLLNFVLWGCTKGCLDIGCNLSCVNFWGKDSPPYVQAIHFCFAVGATIAPLIAGPFLIPQEQEHNSTIFDDNRNDESNGSLFLTVEGDSLGSAPSLQTWIPYTIISLYNLLMSLPFFCLFCIESRRVRLLKKPRANLKKARDPVRAEKKDKYFLVILLVLLGAFVFVYLGHESIYGNFLYTFAVSSDLGFTPETASYLNAAYWGSFAAFRFVAIFIASKVTPKTYLTIDIIGMCISCSALAIFGNTVAEVVWVATILLGASTASIYGSCISWAERYIKLTGKAIAVFAGSSALGDISLPWLMGYLFAVFGTGILMYAMLAVALGSACIYICMLAFASRYGGRYGTTAQKENSVQETDSEKQP